MASKIEICNQALTKLGQPAIMSVSDNTPTARKCFDEFESALGTVLRAYPWPAAMVRKELPRLEEAPPFGFNFFYQIPGDAARIVEIITGGARYQIEGQRLLTDAESVRMRYVSRSVPVDTLDDQLAEVIALNLAMRLCIIITENPQLKDMLHSEYQLMLSQARNTSAIEDFPQEVIEGPWLPSRHGRGGSKDYVQSIWNPWGADGTGVTNG